MSKSTFLGKMSHMELNFNKQNINLLFSYGSFQSFHSAYSKALFYCKHFP